MSITEIIDGLERSTKDLLSALEQQSPAYLEHLERREHLLLQLAGTGLSEPDELGWARLRNVKELGGALEAAARRMRESAAAGVRQTEIDKQLARSLAATAARAYSRLDLKA